MNLPHLGASAPTRRTGSREWHPSKPNYQTLLTEAQEKELFLDFLTESGEQRQKTLLDRIVRAYLPIVKRSVKELSGYGVDSQELESEGNLALVEAAYRYNPELGWRFSTFAKAWVTGIMKGFISKNKFMINVCTSHKKKKLFFQLRKMIGIELRRLGTFEMTEEIAQKMAAEFEVPVIDVHNINALFRAPYISLNEPVSADGENMTTKEDMIPCTGLNPEQHLHEVQKVEHQRFLVEIAMDRTLVERERRIFEAQLLAEDGEQLTLQDLAKEFGVSKERVRQIREVAMEKVGLEARRLTRARAVDLF